MKKVHLLLTALIVSLGLYALTTAAKPKLGNVYSENPYQIKNLANLHWLSVNNDVLG